MQPENSTTSVAEGGALSLKCEGSTTATITWYHNQRKVAPDSRVIVTSLVNATRDVKTSVLAIMTVEESDAGIYVCQDEADYQNLDMVNVTVLPVNISE